MKRGFFIAGAILVIANLLDIISTYLATPDLSGEFNPLVRNFGWGWGAIIILHLIVDVVLLAGLWYYYKTKPARSEVPKKARSLYPIFIWFISGYHTENKQISMKRYLAFIGLVFPLTTIFNSVCNAVLNFSFYLDFFPGLNDDSYMIYSLLKSVIIITAVISSIYIILKRSYLEK